MCEASLQLPLDFTQCLLAQTSLYTSTQAKLKGTGSHSDANGHYRTPYLIFGIGAPNVPVITLKI